MVELGPGYLDHALLPTGLVRRCAAEALDRWGFQTLGYGANAGPLGLRTHLASRVSRAGAARCGPANVMTTAGTSAALDHLAVRLAREGRVVLTEALTYDLARMIFSARGLRTVAVPGPPGDIDVEQLRRVAARVARASGRPPALYVIPTFHNPTGRVIAASRRREIVALAQDLGIVVVEDQAYADLSYEQPPPPSLWSSAADPDLVVTLYSFAKCLAPGMRVGWLVSGERLVAELAADPLRRSGGGANHFAAMVVAAACTAGHLDRHIAGLRERLRLRRDTLLDAIAGSLPDGFSVELPLGGFFAWVRLPRAVGDEDLLREAEARGVSFAAGSRFGAAVRGVRLCFAAQGPAALALGARRFLGACRAVRS